VRLLALADEPPPADPAELVAANRVDLVVTLGDLQPAWIASLGAFELPRIGVHGNHDGEDELRAFGVRDLHLARAEIDGWSFAGFEGCVRYRDGPHQYTQEEAASLARGLPAADVLLCHCPPWGVNDEPDDPAHVGFCALREWVERHEPRYLLHGHTTPDPRTRVRRLGRTKVIWVRGALTVDLGAAAGA
jgi:Icc-related predicted phosphoesterase